MPTVSLRAVIKVQARCFCPSGERLPSFYALARPCAGRSLQGCHLLRRRGLRPVAAGWLRSAFGFGRASLRLAPVGPLRLRSNQVREVDLPPAVRTGEMAGVCPACRSASCPGYGLVCYVFCLVYAHFLSDDFWVVLSYNICTVLLFCSGGALFWGCPVLSLSPVVVGFSGSRSLSVGCLPLVGRVVRGAIAAGLAPAVGCCVGADSLVLSAALVGGFAARLSVLAAFGPSGAGALSSSAVSLVESCAAAGAAVSWWCGGGASVPVSGRLASRSLALVRFCAGSAGLAGGAPFVSFVAAPCPAGLAPCRRPFSGSGSGSWATAAAAAWAGCALSVFWCGAGAPVLPVWPGGAWSPVASGWLAGAWAWSPVVQPSLF